MADDTAGRDYQRVQVHGATILAANYDDDPLAYPIVILRDDQIDRIAQAVAAKLASSLPA